MGCDIHLYIEKKIKGKWMEFKDIPHSEYPDGRNYSVFALLAGVRGGYKKVYFPSRGIPADTSYKERGMQNDFYSEDDLWLGHHSFTYATIYELKKVNWMKYLEYEPQFMFFIQKWFPLQTSSDKNIRILMGFDS